MDKIYKNSDLRKNKTRKFTSSFMNPYKLIFNIFKFIYLLALGMSIFNNFA